MCHYIKISMAESKTVVSQVLMHWRYHSLALSHCYGMIFTDDRLPKCLETVSISTFYLRSHELSKPLNMCVKFLIDLDFGRRLSNTAACWISKWWNHFDGLVQDCGPSGASTMETPLSLWFKFINLFITEWSVKNLLMSWLIAEIYFEGKQEHAKFT